MHVKPLLLFNWNSYGTKEIIIDFFEYLRLQSFLEQYQCTVLLPHLYSYLYHQYSPSPLLLGSQTCSKINNIHSTGMITASMLHDIGVNSVCIGSHSRQKNLVESQEDYILQIEQALNNDLIILFHITETFHDHKKKTIKHILQKQLGPILYNFETQLTTDNFIIVYEPVWELSEDEDTVSDVYCTYIYEAIHKLLPTHLHDFRFILSSLLLSPSYYASYLSKTSLSGFMFSMNPQWMSQLNEHAEQHNCDSTQYDYNI